MTSINNLKADHKNARKRTDRSADLIKESLERYGAARSIVIDEENRILAGNGTVEGAKAAGIKNLRIIDTEGDEIIAIRRTGLSEDEKVGLALADNRTSDLSEWDQEMLHHLSKEHDLAPWFEQTDLDSLLEDAEAAFPELDDGDKQPFQQMAFTLHDDQAVIVQEALTKAKTMGNFDESINENSNGNALARVAELFLSWGSDHGLR
jgi:ParB family transcriptional regulator, chromosome partitioning protein